jgi:hypothetical protein
MSPNKNKQQRNKNKFANSGLVRKICIFHSQLPNLTELVLNRSAQTWKTALGCIQYLRAYIFAAEARIRSSIFVLARWRRDLPSECTQTTTKGTVKSLFT